MRKIPILLAGLTFAAAMVATSAPAPAGDVTAPRPAANGSGIAKAADPKLAAREPVQWLTFPEGIKLAAETKKPILVDVYTSWCGWCKRMDATTYHDEKVIQILNDKFIVVKINAESNVKTSYMGQMLTFREICGDAWGVTGYPTTVFLKPGGGVITPLGGYMTADRLAPILRYIGTGAYETMKFDEFIKKNS